MKSKYNNVKTVIDSLTFDSKREAKHYSELKIMEKAKLIKDLRLQVPYQLIPAQKGGLRKELCMTYVADFVYYDIEECKTVIADSKGVKTPIYIIKRKLMKLMGNEVTEL